MSETAHGNDIQDTFNSVADGYDSPALRFFPAGVEHLVSSLALCGDEHVLDVASGTGHGALALARRLPQGRVTGVDFSSAMLACARRKMQEQQFDNVHLLERDMRDLGFAGGTFDAAICAFGIFFVEDMVRQLAHIAAAVKPGGQVGICSFHEGYFLPLRELLGRRLERYGVQFPAQGWKRVAQEEGCREMFTAAGLGEVRVTRHSVGYFLPDEQQWWDIVWNAGYRRLVGQLSAVDLTRFHREHLAEIAALASDEGIWLDVDVLCTVGTRAVQQGVANKG